MSAADSQAESPRYTVLEELGRGGMGRVVLAFDEILEREVAIKTLFLGDFDSQLRFVAEAQITGQLAHPNIVTVHELGGLRAEPFLVMKRVQGQTLEDVLRELRESEPGSGAGAEFGIRRLVRLLLKACEAVAHAHERGVVHRDLKPANLMLDEHDEVLVLDWGLARTLADGGTGAEPDAQRSTVRVPSREDRGGLTMAGAVLGTPAYMPPEQAEDATQADARSDVYSLGAVLYEILTRRPPYLGKAYEILNAVVHDDPPPPRALATEVPPALEAICLKAMARRPAERYRDADELGAELARYLDDEAVSAYRETASEAARRLVARHRQTLLLALILAGLLLLLLVGGLVWVSEQRRTVAAEVAELEAAVATAERAAQTAAAAQADTQRTIVALPRAGQAARVAASFVAAAETLIPLTDADRQSSAAGASREPVRQASLEELRARARQSLTGIRSRVVDALRGEEALLAELSDPVMARFDRQFAAAGFRIEQAWAEALLARRPSLLVASAGAIELADWRPLFEARALLRLGDREAALRVLVEAPALPADAPPGLVTCRRALRAVVSDAAFSEQERLLSAAIVEIPELAWLYLRRGEARAQLGRWDEARADFQQATLRHAIDAWIYPSRMLHTRSVLVFHELTAGLRDVTRRLSPENLEADFVHLRARIYYRGANLDDFVADLAARSSLQAWRFGARGALIVRDLERAGDWAERVLSHVPDDRIGRRVAAEVALRRGQHAQALELARSALERFPDDARFLWVQGRAAHQLGERRLARQSLERAARASLDPEPWRHLGELLLESTRPEDWEAGAEAAREAVARTLVAGFTSGRARPLLADPRNYRLLAHLERKRGRPAAAALLYARAHQLSTTPNAEGAPPQRAVRALGEDFQDLEHLARVHEELGLVQVAASYWTQLADEERASAEQRELARQALERLRRGG